MPEYALGQSEVLPGLTQKLLDDTKTEIRKALEPFKGRTIDEDTKASMVRQIEGAMHRMRRRPGQAPFPVWLRVHPGSSHDELMVEIRYDKLPKGWDPSKVRTALGIEI